MKAIVKSLAGCVLVSFGEFANRASIRLPAIAADLRRIGDALLEPAHRALAEAAALVEQLVVEQDRSTPAALACVGSLDVEGADDVEGPVERAVALLRPDGRMQRHLSPTFQPNFFISATFTERAVRVLRNAASGRR
jgi:hypothetical protein